ncbi:Homogentisate 1,2-dioxygenase [Vararia minispora EC-137]|uniref:Homogentisate 1,2-dioxygenase n=1 Tax=Vararia minispora EC-137 TaxID=1314806 RepID=A0ACB8QS62_9AGAM|nr:Homogentisate 1,2-dioxygenase [Vararia minispora EC-137]
MLRQAASRRTLVHLSRSLFPRATRLAPATLPAPGRRHNSSSSSRVTAQSAILTKPTEKDPYAYMPGFGNRFSTEAVPGTLPDAQNSPQKCKYDLYAEHVTGASFVTPRSEAQTSWLYRIRPSVAHQGFKPLPDNPDLEHNFSSLNPRVHVSPTQLAWHPFDIPSEPTTFVEGLKTLCGSGEPTLREGVAFHIYAANKSMENEAFCNNDGHMMILPQQGRLDIQTEYGHLMARSGELVVIQRGMRFKVAFPDGPSRGYIQEIFGSRFELPDLGPLGTHGLANPRDFETPVASFDVDQSPWKIVYKVCGRLFACTQEHTPFDVVAWHGNYAPYKYAMEKFVNVGSISKDHIDPSIFCVLTAKSKTANHALTDFLIFSPRWDVASHTFRPPYYHRNAATEFMGLLYGVYGGRSDEFQPGGASYETGFCPHGVSYDEFKAATEAELKPGRVHEGTIAFMFESSLMLPLTDYAIKRSGKLHEHEPKMWDNLNAQFLNHLDQVNADLKKAGMLGVTPKVEL